MIKCPECNHLNETDASVCANCNASLVDKAKKKKKPLLLVAVIALIVVLLGGALALYMKFGVKKQRIVYVKESEIFLTNSSKAKPFKLDNWDDDSTEYTALGLRFDKRQKAIFYPDFATQRQLSLYYRDLSSPSSVSLKIVDNYIDYKINEKGNIVTYLDDQTTLYQYDLDKDMTGKIHDDVVYYYPSPDGKTLYYLDSDDRLYVKVWGKAKERIDGNVDRVEYISDNYKSVFFLKKEGLYKKTLKKKLVKVDSDVLSVFHAFDDKNLYYLKVTEYDIDFNGYILDEYMESDEVLKSPTAPGDSPTGEEVEDFNRAIQEYSDKLRRDDVRKLLEQEQEPTKLYSLYYYNGKKGAVVADQLLDPVSHFAAKSKSMVAFTTINPASDKVDINLLLDINSYEELAKEIFSHNSLSHFVTLKGTPIGLPKDGVLAGIDPKAKFLYYFSNYSEDGNYADLFYAPIKKSKLESPSQYDDKVYTAFINIGDKGQAAYMKNLNDVLDRGDLYYNKKLVDNDVFANDYLIQNVGNDLYFFTGDDPSAESASLKHYKKGKVKTLGNDVSAFILLKDKSLVFFKDYNSRNETGDLFVYTGSKSKRVDYDVNIFSLKFLLRLAYKQEAISSLVMF